MMGAADHLLILGEYLLVLLVMVQSFINFSLSRLSPSDTGSEPDSIAEHLWVLIILQTIQPCPTDRGISVAM